jgi:hypothetical protein
MMDGDFLKTNHVGVEPGQPARRPIQVYAAVYATAPLYVPADDTHMILRTTSASKT